LNCDLTEANGTSLDANNLNHFMESSVTDFYVRYDVGKTVRGTSRSLTPDLKRRHLASDAAAHKDICDRLFV
jgi:hypothetical protein